MACNMALARQHNIDLTGGPVATTLLAFSMPMFFANLCQAVYNIVDMAIVGQAVGPTGLSGVAIGTDLMHFLLFMSMGMSNAGQVLISQNLGSNDMKRVRRIIETLLTFMLICASAITVLALVLCPLALDLMNTPEDAYAEALIYTAVCMCGMPLTFLFNSCSAVMRAFGNSRTPMMLAVAATIINIALDLLFVMVFQWGVLGAALATIVGQGVSFSGAMLFLRFNQESYSIEVGRALLHIDKSCLGPLVKLGVPMGLQTGAVMFSKAFVNSWVNSYGLDVSAATGVGARLMSIGGLFVFAISQGGAVMMARSIGARDKERVNRILGVSYACDFLWTGVCSAACLLFPTQLFGFFTSDESVIQIGCEYAIILVLEFMAAAVRSPMLSFVNASAKPLLNLLVALLDGIVGRIGVGLLLGLGLGMGYMGFWLGGAIASFMPFFVGLVYYLTGFRKL